MRQEGGQGQAVFTPMAPTPSKAPTPDLITADQKLGPEGCLARGNYSCGNPHPLTSTSELLEDTGTWSSFLPDQHRPKGCFVLNLVTFNIEDSGVPFSSFTMSQKVLPLYTQ